MAIEQVWKKKLCMLIILLLNSLLNAQNDSTIKDKVLTLKVKTIKSSLYKDFCEKANVLKDAIVVEFEVVNEEDKKKFGNKIYVITICEGIPNDVALNSTEVWELEISEIQYYCWNINIFNEELLDKNVDRKKFWNRGLSKNVILHCGFEKM